MYRKEIQYIEYNFIKKADETIIVMPDEGGETSAAEQVATGDGMGLPAVSSPLTTISEEEEVLKEEGTEQEGGSAAEEVATGSDLMSDPLPPPGSVLYHESVSRIA